MGAAPDLKVDVVVIGSGPGGEGAAMQLSKGGKRVALVEKYEQIGGGCTHWGTIPSKALRSAIFQLTEALNNKLLQNAGVKANASIADLRRSARSIIEKQEGMRRNFYNRNDVDVVVGHARFEDEHTISIDGGQKVTAEHFVIAVGSRPYRPGNVDFAHPRIFDSDKILELEEMPHTMTVYLSLIHI